MLRRKWKSHAHWINWLLVVQCWSFPIVSVPWETLTKSSCSKMAGSQKEELFRNSNAAGESLVAFSLNRIVIIWSARIVDQFSALQQCARVMYSFQKLMWKPPLGSPSHLYQQSRLHASK